MIKRMRSDVKYVFFGVLIFALAMGFTFSNYKPANAAGQENPLVGFHYALDIQGMVKGYFTAAYNIGSENEVAEQKVMGERGKQVATKAQVLGRLKFSDVTLKRGITSNIDLPKWRQMVERGEIANARRDGVIIMYDQTLKEVARWNVTRAWPSKLIYNPVDASATSSSSGMAIESVTITVDSIQRVK